MKLNREKISHLTLKQVENDKKILDELQKFKVNLIKAMNNLKSNKSAEDLSQEECNSKKIIIL